MDKCEYLTGEDLGLNPNTIEQARFEYSPLGKIFNKGLSEDDQEEGLFKRLKYTENAQKNLIKDEKKKLEPIKNEEQSVLEDKSTVAGKKSKEIMLLKDKLDFIFKNFDSNFNSTGKKFLTKVAKDEKKIDYNNLLFEIVDKSFVKC